MSEAISRIVNGYVSLKNREALEKLRDHRQDLKRRLRDRPAGEFDVSYSIRLFDDDLAIIEAGLERL